MRIGIDNDECLAEFVYSFLYFHNYQYGTCFQSADVHSYNLWELLGCTKEESIKHLYTFYESPFFSSLPVVFGAREAVRQLFSDHDLVVITSRPETIREKTYRWVNSHFPDRFSEIIFTNEWSLYRDRSHKTKGSICQDRGISLMIEDNAPYANECARQGLNVFLLNKPWNLIHVLHPHVHRVRDWHHLFEGVQKL